MDAVSPAAPAASCSSPSTTPRSWLIIGSDGQVGAALVEALRDGDAEVAGTVLGATGPLGLDLSDLGQLPARLDALLSAHRVDVVVNAAGFTSAEECQRSPERADLLNHGAAAIVADRAARAGARSVYLSSEYVFDGVDGPYDEDASPRPLSVYGRSKVAGEEAVLGVDPLAVVVRTTVVYGPEEVGKNFAYQLADRLRQGRTMQVAVDQVSTPTYNRDLASAIVAIVKAGNAPRLVHLCGPDRLSRAGFAVQLAGLAGLDHSLIVALPTGALRQLAPRPLEAGLVSKWPIPPMRAAEAAVDDWLRHPRGRPWPEPVMTARPPSRRNGWRRGHIQSSGHRPSG